MCYYTAPSASRKFGFYPQTLRKLTRKKCKLWNKCRNCSHDPRLRELYRDCVNKWRHEIRSLEMYKENAVIKSQNLSAFYKFVYIEMLLVHWLMTVVTLSLMETKRLNCSTIILVQLPLSITMLFLFVTVYYAMIVYWTRWNLSLRTRLQQCANVKAIYLVGPMVSRFINWTSKTVSGRATSS